MGISGNKKKFLGKYGVIHFIEKIKELINPINTKLTTIENKQIDYTTCTEAELQEAINNSD